MRRLPPCLLLLYACGPPSISYHPPPQKKIEQIKEEFALTSFVRMNDANAKLHIVADVSDTDEGSWRWAYSRPELRFFLNSVENQVFVMSFALPEATFRETGPVTLSLFVNGTLAGRERYPAPGHQYLEKAVPAAILLPNAANSVVVKPEPVWVSAQDGARLGFVLSSAGFRKK